MSVVPDRHSCHYPVWQRALIHVQRANSCRGLGCYDPHPLLICYHTYAYGCPHSTRLGRNDHAPTPQPHAFVWTHLHQWLKPWHQQWGWTQTPAATSAAVTSSKADVLTEPLGITVQSSSWFVVPLINIPSGILTQWSSQLSGNVSPLEWQRARISDTAHLFIEHNN